MTEMSKKNTEPTDPTARLLARILRSLLASERFDDRTDLVDALKFRLARLRIPYHPDHLDHALRMVASNRWLTTRERPAPHRPPPTPDPPPYASHDEAVAVLKRLGVTL
jgi:hypothetical protein